MKKFIISLVNKKRNQWREERFNLFLKNANIQKGSTILDLGGHDGGFFHNFQDKINHLDLKIIIADVDKQALEVAKSRGFEVLLIAEDEKISLDDQSIDMIFCNSVIEHITVPSSEIWTCTDEEYFNNTSWKRQEAFANEILRVGKGYFVQTPHVDFIIEAHSWLPLVTRLSRINFIKVLRFTNKFWIVKSAPGCHLLNEVQMKKLFDNADNVYVKKIFGSKKEVIAYKK